MTTKKEKTIMFEFNLPPLVQTEDQKAYCAAGLAKAEAEAKARNKLVEKWLGASLGGVMESRIQVNINMPENRIAKLASFASQFGIKVCVGRWTGLLLHCASDADKRLEQIILSFDFGVHVSQEEMADFKKAIQS